MANKYKYLYENKHKKVTFKRFIRKKKNRVKILHIRRNTGIFFIIFKLLIIETPFNYLFYGLESWLKI